VSFRLPLAPWTNWLVVMFIVVEAVLLAINSESRLAYYSAGCWFAILLVADAFATRARGKSPRY
jgi:AAT family amino acid transporter/D-serine/D-alanine/glycine transporter